MMDTSHLRSIKTTGSEKDATAELVERHHMIFSLMGLNSRDELPKGVRIIANNRGTVKAARFKADS